MTRHGEAGLMAVAWALALIPVAVVLTPLVFVWAVTR
jgi:hypothetical protein